MYYDIYFIEDILNSFLKIYTIATFINKTEIIAYKNKFMYNRYVNKFDMFRSILSLIIYGKSYNAFKKYLNFFSPVF